MSIVLIDDVLFNDNLEERTIRYNNCIFFVILNGTSIFLGLFFLYIYFMIPRYNNISNILCLFFSLFNLISNVFYFLIFFELYLYDPTVLSVSSKIIAMFNPLIILCIYYWSASLTHHLYATYYKYSHDMVKRFKNYQYLLFVVIIIFYIYTLLNIDYNDSRILSKDFTFISNYKISYINFFYISGFFIILFILYQLYFVLNKKEDFIISEYQETRERSEGLKIIFGSEISRNIACVCYFLLAYVPENTIMLLKFFFNKKNIKCYFIQIIIISLISFFGSFLFLVKLFDPLIRKYLINLLLFNREFIDDFDINISPNETNLPLLFEGENQIRKKNKQKTVMFSHNFKIKDDPRKRSLSPSKKSTNKKGGNSNIYVSKLSKPIKEMSENLESNLNNNIKNDKNYEEMKDLDYFGRKNNSNLNPNEDLYSDKNNSSQVDSNNTSKLYSDISLNKDDNLNEKNNSENYHDNKNIFEEQKYNSPNLNKNINSFGKKDIFSRNTSKNSVKKRNNTNILGNSYNEDGVVYLNKNNISTNKTKIMKSFHKKNKLKNSNSSVNVRSLSTNSNILNRQKRQCNRSISKNHEFINEEISCFAFLNYHLEVNENLLRMIAISISVDECRKYDNLEEYKKYYKSTIPWENKKFYIEKTKYREYNDKNIPNWLGIENDKRFTNIRFKIMAYCPFVFHHIRIIDKISIDDFLISLDPIKNIQKLKEGKVSGGRGNNSLFCTWDKKIIIKTIDTNEKNILFEKMITDFHCFMRESRSILSRIYGLFKIELNEKGSIYVIVQRNMDDLPLKTKLLTFDFKGSTVDRQIILKGDTALQREKLWAKYKNRVLKDKDLDLIGLKFILDFKNWKQITSIVDSDSSFLQNLGVIDYSLVVFIHEYQKEDLENNKECSRIIASKDNKYIFNFSIVDYLGTYNIMKKGESLTKNILGYIKKSEDTNFSVLDPKNYGVRFRNFVKRIILDE